MDVVETRELAYFLAVARELHFGRAAESLGIALMESMQSSDPTAIIGLPLIELTRMLTSFGLDPLQHAGGQA